MATSRCSTLVSVKWLKNLITSKPGNHRILDASYHLPHTGRNAKAEYEQRHIPGAVFFDIDDCSKKDNNLPHMIPTAKCFEEYAGQLGINNETHVIIYDNSSQFPFFSAQRVWWTFRLFGHSNISLVEGGLQKWLAENGEVTEVIPSVEKQIFNANVNQSLIQYYEDIEKNIRTQVNIVVDARPEGRFKGTAPEPRPDTKSGCIPGSKNIPFMKMMNTEEQRMKSVEEMKTIFQEAGVDLEKPFVVSCGSGITACMLALSAHLCGQDAVAVYDGSWTEWYHRAPAELKLNVPSDK